MGEGRRWNTIKSGSPEKQRSACVVVGVFDNRNRACPPTWSTVRGLHQRNHPPRHGGQTGSTARTTSWERFLSLARRFGQGATFGARVQTPCAAVRLLNETGFYEAVVYLTEEKVKRREVAWRVEHAVVAAMEAAHASTR